eukprot:1440655-Heterocapsa_arctica.AAC.1
MRIIPQKHSSNATADAALAAIVITTTRHIRSSFGKGAACTTTWPRPKPSITVRATLNFRRPP